MKRVTLTYQNKDFSKPIEYTFNLIFSILGIEFQIFPYAEVPSRSISTCHNDIFGSQRRDPGYHLG